MRIGKIAPAVLLTIYNVLLVKVYMGAFLKGKGRAGIIGWLSFAIWEVVREMEVLNVGAMGILTGQSPGWNLIWNVAMLWAVGLASYTGRIWKRLLFPAAYVALLTVAEALVVFGAEYAGVHNVTIFDYLLASNIFMTIMALGIRCFVKRRDMDGMEPSDGRVMLLAVLAGIVLYYAFFRLAWKAGPDDMELVFWLCVSALMLLGLDLCVYPVCVKLAEAVWTKRNNHEYLKQIALYKDQRKLEQEAREEIGRIKHDLKQSMIYLSNLLVHQEYGRMKEVLDSLYGELEEKSCMEGKSGNLALDSLVSRLAQESKKNGITLHVDMDITGTLRMEDVEICVMAGNLFDNAVEASVRILEGREIWVGMSCGKGYMRFQVKNRYDRRLQRDGSGAIKSSKDGLHGFGLRSVKKIVHKHNGHMEISEEEDVFCVEIRLFC